MTPVLAWCPKCGGYVPVTLVKQPVMIHHKDVKDGETCDSYPSAVIECTPRRHALLAIGYDHDE